MRIFILQVMCVKGHRKEPKREQCFQSTLETKQRELLQNGLCCWKKLLRVESGMKRIQKWRQRKEVVQRKSASEGNAKTVQQSSYHVTIEIKGRSLTWKIRLNEGFPTSSKTEVHIEVSNRRLCRSVSQAVSMTEETRARATCLQHKAVWSNSFQRKKLLWRK